MRRRSTVKAFALWGSIAFALAAATGAAAVTHKAPPADLTQATPGFLYFNRPGASMAEHDADLAECRRAATANPPATGIQPNYTSGVAGVLASGIADAGMVTAYRQARTQWCMVALGWRLVQLDARTAERLAPMHQEKLAKQLEPMVGAANPPGRIVASFSNQAASGETVRFQGSNNNDVTSFSNRAMVPVRDDDARAWRIAAAGLPSSPGARPAEAWSAKFADGLDPDPQQGLFGRRREVAPPPPLPATPPGMATVLVRVVGDNAHEQLGVEIDPIDIPDAKAFGVRVPRRAKDQAMERTVAVHVAPGRYRLGSLIGPQPFAPITVDLCLGSPSFEVKAGEVVFLGSFDMAHDLTPDLSLAPAQSFMAGVETLKNRTGELQAAHWTNGSTGVCGGTYFYALAFPNAPYAEGWTGPRLP